MVNKMNTAVSCHQNTVTIVNDGARSSWVVLMGATFPSGRLPNTGEMDRAT